MPDFWVGLWSFEEKPWFIAKRTGTGCEVTNGIFHVPYIIGCSSEMAPYSARADGSTV